MLISFSGQFCTPHSICRKVRRLCWMWLIGDPAIVILHRGCDYIVVSGGSSAVLSRTRTTALFIQDSILRRRRRQQGPGFVRHVSSDSSLFSRVLLCACRGASMTSKVPEMLVEVDQATHDACGMRHAVTDSKHAF